MAITVGMMKKGTDSGMNWIKDRMTEDITGIYSSKEK